MYILPTFPTQKPMLTNDVLLKTNHYRFFFIEKNWMQMMKQLVIRNYINLLIIAVFPNILNLQNWDCQIGKLPDAKVQWDHTTLLCGVQTEYPDPDPRSVQQNILKQDKIQIFIFRENSCHFTYTSVRLH